MSHLPERQTTTTHPQWWVSFCCGLWQVLKYVWGAVLLVLALNILAAWLISKSLDFHGTPLGWILDHLLYAGFIGLSLLLLTVLVGVVCYLGKRVSPQQEATTQIEQNRSALLGLLAREYRRELTQSLQGAVKIELGLQERIDVISSPAQLLSWRLDTSDKSSLATYSSIIEAYDEASAALLILGAPGAGKSTLLRELASELVTRAQENPNQPIPVIVNLSSWATKKLPLATWLLEQLQLVYAIPRQLSQALIGQNHLLLLLDGLDEVAASARPTCIEYINAYRAAHFIPLVVCSRSHQYLEQMQRLTLPYAVEIQALTPEQVDGYLKYVGKPLAAVRTALRSNAVLRELVTTPLMLSIVMLTYRGKTAKDLPQLGTAEEQQRQVFEHYVDRMLNQPARKWSYTSQQTRNCLIWLAQQMEHHQLTDFYLERLQRDWLPTERAKKLYPWLFRLILGLVFGLFGGLFTGLFVGLVFGLVGGLFVGLVLGLAIGGDLLGSDIQPTEILSWSWSRFQRNVVVILLSVVFGVGVGVVLIGRLVFGLVGGLVLGLLFGLLGGLSAKQLDEGMRFKPNQGIQSSGRNALRLGLFFGLVFGLVFGLLTERVRLRLFSGAVAVLLIGLAVGLVFGLLVGLPKGGDAYLNHYMLRFLLWRSGVMPWHTIRFLDEATDRILLQPVGGGYRFIHPLLQDYFASLDAG